MGKLFRLADGRPLPAAGVKVIKSADCETLYGADRILEAARQEAQEIALKAQDAYQQRYEAGYQDGVEAGRMEHAEKVMETVLASVEFIEKIESTVVDVVNQSVRKIIGELDDAERIQRIVGTALNNVRGQLKVTVRVAPADEPTVMKAFASMTSGSYLNVVADPHLKQGSCILESELGVVDASLETQLKALEKAFTSKIRQ